MIVPVAIAPIGSDDAEGDFLSRVLLQQLGKKLAVVGIVRRYHHAGDQFALDVETAVRFVAEEVLRLFDLLAALKAHKSLGEARPRYHRLRLVQKAIRRHYPVVDKVGKKGSCLMLLEAFAVHGRLLSLWLLSLETPLRERRFAYGLFNSLSTWQLTRPPRLC